MTEIDVSSESLVRLSEVCRLLPGRPHLSTIYRWRLVGVRGVRLVTCLIGGRRYTSREALQRFVAATTASADGDPVPVRTSRQRQRDIERAEGELKVSERGANAGKHGDDS